MSTTVAGRYELEDAIGQGNFSTVSLAKVAEEFREKAGKSCPRLIALKWTMKLEEHKVLTLRKEWKVYEALIKEAQNAAGVLAPAADEPYFFDTSEYCIVGAYEFVETDDRCGIALEACECDLMSFLQKQAVPVSERLVCSIMKQLLTALDYVHKLGYVHRDVKPHNILVTRDSQKSALRIRLSDFGLAKPIGKTNLWARQNSAGDYDFMPPEVQESTEAHTPLRRDDFMKSDSYAAGLCMCYLLTGNLDKVVVQTLNSCRTCADVNDGFRDSHLARWSNKAIDVLLQLLTLNSSNRAFPSEALAHPWFDMLLSSNTPLDGDAEAADEERHPSSEMLAMLPQQSFAALDFKYPEDEADDDDDEAQ